MHRLVLDMLPEGSTEGLKPSFDSLPRTSHLDGDFRFRRYSLIDYYGLSTGKSEFNQSSEYNKYQGDLLREFEPVEESALSDKGFRKFYGAFREIGNLYFEDVGVHQMRIYTESKTVDVSPEGTHQDGFDVVGILGVHRHNIDGGDALAFMEKSGPPILSRRLESGEYIIFDDRKLWHSAKPITTIDKTTPGYMDAFILTASRDES